MPRSISQPQQLHELSIKTPVLEYQFVLTDPTTIAIQLPGRVVVIDKKTGNVVKVVPEMPGHDPWLHKLSEAISGIAQVLHATHGLQGAEELQLGAAKLLTALVERVSQEVQAGKPTTRVA